MTAPQLGDHYYHNAALNQHHHHNHHHVNRYSPPVSPRSQPHGLKRRLSHGDEGEENVQISNDFKKLRLNNRLPRVVGPDGAVQSRNFLQDNEIFSASPPSGGHASGDDLMTVDDTSHRVFITDLEAEIAAIEAEEARDRAGIMLSQTGQDMAKIPAHLLRPQAADDSHAPNMQMVLYRDPTSISIPEEEDAVRKAIIAARARAREKNKDQVPAPSTGLVQVQPSIDQDDPDAMDMG